MIGTPTVLLSPLTADAGTSWGPAVDITCLVDSVAIRHGRDDTTSQPQASTATLDISLDTDTDAQPSGLDVGAKIEVRVTVSGTSYTRFVGRVTDTSVGWDDYGPDTPNRPVLQVLAASELAELGRRVVGDVPWPQELDGARVARILSAAGTVTNPANNDPGRATILARDVDSQPALDLAYAVAIDASGLVWQSRGGEVRYADSEHRRGVTSTLTLDACDVLVTPVWQRTTDGLLNSVTVVYGVAPDGGERPAYSAISQASRDRYGRYEQSLTTQLAALADAQALALLLTTRNNTPVWVMEALPVDVVGLSTADTQALLALEVHSLIELTGMPAIGTVPTTTMLWVEGWSEALRYGEHELTLSISGYCRTVPPPHWDDVPTSVSWDTVGTMTWDAASCMGPLPVRGDRWDDQPASVRWDQLTPAQTWDTFTGATVPVGE